MNWWRILDAVFPYIEPLDARQREQETRRLEDDIAAIKAAAWQSNEERALEEAQRVAAAEMDRVRTAETKATTYLAVLAALVPIIITLQAAEWEKKAGPAPDAARLLVLTVGTAYLAAAGYHAFKTLQVTAFQSIREDGVVEAWRTPSPLAKLTRNTLLASRQSREAVNSKVTRIKVTHEHLLRAFATFILLLLLNPFFYAIGYRNAAQEPAPPRVVDVQHPQPVLRPPGRADENAATQKPGSDGKLLPGVDAPVTRHRARRSSAAAERDHRQERIYPPRPYRPADPQSSPTPETLPSEVGPR